MPHLSNPQPLTVRYRLAEAEFLLAHGLYLRSSAARSLRRVSWLLGIGSLVLAVLYFDPSGGMPSYGRTAALAGLGIATLFLSGPGLRWMVRRRYRRRQDVDREIHMEFRDEYFTASMGDAALSKIAWTALQKAVLAPEGALLFLAPRQYLYVAGSGFTDVAARERFDDLVRQKCATVLDLD